MMEFSNKLKQDIELIEQSLERYLSDENGQGYDLIFEAVRYSALAGGKRLRPVLLLEFCTMCGGEVEKALPFACALEMMHTYSLIHDDLPCMDNDDLRRGRATSHKVFGEGVAVLAGDALLTRAFEIASGAQGVDADTALRCTRALAQAVGMHGMIGGQVLDLESEHKTITLEQLTRLQELKTGALLQVPCVIGCLIAGRQEREILDAAASFGSKLGLAFQIQDDILDIEGDSTQLGKTVGKDAKSEKSTFPSLIGIDACRERVRELTDEAVASLCVFQNNTFLRTLAEHLVGRHK